MSARYAPDIEFAIGICYGVVGVFATIGGGMAVAGGDVTSGGIIAVLGVLLLGAGVGYLTIASRPRRPLHERVVERGGDRR